MLVIVMLLPYLQQFNMIHNTYIMFMRKFERLYYFEVGCELTRRWTFFSWSKI